MDAMRLEIVTSKNNVRKGSLSEVVGLAVPNMRVNCRTWHSVTYIVLFRVYFRALHSA